MFDYKCSACGFQEEYSTNTCLPKEMLPPENCPKCKEGKLQKLSSYAGQSFDPGRYSYEYTYGKKAWKRNMSPSDQAKVLAGEIPPY